MLRLLGAVCLLVCVAGCGRHTLSQQELHQTREDRTLTIPRLSLSGEERISWSVEGDELSLAGYYQGTSRDGHLGTGWVVGSGHFGMVDEPVEVILSGSWAWSGSEIIASLTTGSLLFGPRNIHNSSAVSGSLSISLPSDLQHILEMIETVPALGSLGGSRENDIYRIDTPTISGWGDQEQLVLTGEVDQHVRTGVLQDDTWTIEHDNVIVSWTDSGDTLDLIAEHRRTQRVLIECTISADLRGGMCLSTPPRGDAFTSQGHLVREWSTDLASE